MLADNFVEDVGPTLIGLKPTSDEFADVGQRRPDVCLSWSEIDRVGYMLVDVGRSCLKSGVF